jgi:DNA-binding transcriptional regulator YiaG
MKKETKRESFIYEGLGFPIRLINVPMKKIFGEWAMDINFNILQKNVLHMLAGKPTSLSSDELRFIMGYLEMSTRQFANLFDVTHVAVLKWLKGDAKMNPNTEICLRLYLLDYLCVTDKEFRKLYVKIRERNLADFEYESHPMEIDAEKIAC